MPSALNAIFGADATPFVKALKVMETSAARTGQMTVAQMQISAREIQNAADKAQAAGQSTAFYSQALRKLNQDITAATAAQNRLADAASRTAKAEAAVAGGFATNSQRRLAQREAVRLRDERAGALDRETRASVRRSQEESQAQNAMLDIEERSQRKRDELARQGWIRRLREARRARAIERFEAAHPIPAPRRSGPIGQFFRDAGSNLFNRFLGPGAVLGGVYSMGRFIVESVQADIAMQRIRNTLKTASGSARQAAGDFEFLLAASKRIGFSFADNADHFARFSIAAKNAGLTASATRNVFTSVMEAAASMGLSSERTGEAMLALEQMLSKGVVSAQELRLQLGNALPSAVNTMAKALGITVAQLFRALEAGSLNSADAVQKFAAQLKKDFNLTDDANKTIRDINRLKTAWFELKAAVGEGGRGPISGLLEGTTDQINRINLLIAKLDELAGKTDSKRPGLVSTALQKAFIGSLGFGALNSPVMDRALAADAAARQALADATAGASGGMRGNPLDAAANGLIEGNKEKSLNDLLLRRIQIQDMLKDSIGLSAAAAERLRDALRDVNVQIDLQRAESPKMKAQIQRDAAFGALDRARRELLKADAHVKDPGLSAHAAESAVSARGVAAANVKKAEQVLRAAEEALALTPNEELREKDKRESISLSEERRRRGFDIGNLGQSRAGTFTGPSIVALDIGRRQLARLESIDRELKRSSSRGGLNSSESY